MEVKQQRHAYKLTQPPWLTLTQDSIWCTSTRNQEKIKRELGDISCWYLSLLDSTTGRKIATHCLLILLHSHHAFMLHFLGPRGHFTSILSPQRALWLARESTSTQCLTTWHFQYSSTSTGNKWPNLKELNPCSHTCNPIWQGHADTRLTSERHQRTLATDKTRHSTAKQKTAVEETHVMWTVNILLEELRSDWVRTAHSLLAGYTVQSSSNCVSKLWSHSVYAYHLIGILISREYIYFLRILFAFLQLHQMQFFLLEIYFRALFHP